MRGLEERLHFPILRMRTGTTPTQFRVDHAPGMILGCRGQPNPELLKERGLSFFVPSRLRVSPRLFPPIARRVTTSDTIQRTELLADFVKCFTNARNKT